MNRWNGIGRLVKDPELNYAAGKGTPVCKFTIAVDKGFGDKKKTAFIPVIVFGKSGEAAANNLTKGSKVAIEGSIDTGSYTNKQGQKVYTTNIIAEMIGGVEFLDSKSTKSNNDSGGSYNQGSFEDEMTPVYGGDMPF